VPHHNFEGNCNDKFSYARVNKKDSLVNVGSTVG
jgi:hypothetical protein